MHGASASSPSPSSANEAAGAKTDISIDLITLRRCRFDDHLFDRSVVEGIPVAAPQGESTDFEMTVDIGMWFEEGGRSAIVQLAIGIMPKSQPSWSALVDVIGKYSCGENPVLPLERFARNNGIAYLVPFARERLANLVSASVFKSFILPPMSVAELISRAGERGGPTEAQHGSMPALSE